jgi:ParB family chromosome partitioning protein
MFHVEHPPEAGMSANVVNVPVDHIRRGAYQPRRRFTEEDLERLADSILSEGIIQPLVLRPVAGGGWEKYELLAGERRWRAAQQAGLHAVPAIIREDVDDASALRIALIENLQRQELSPIEEAEALQRLNAEFGLTHAEIAKQIGKSREAVTNVLRLLQLDTEIQDLVHAGGLSAGHARLLIGMSSVEQAMHARAAVKTGMSVRQFEQSLRQWPGRKKRKGQGARGNDSDIERLERIISSVTGLPVTIRHDKDGGGELRFRYHSLDELDGLLRHLPSGE